MYTDPHFLTAMLLYMAYNPQYKFCRQWLNSACTLISVPGSILNTNVVFIRLFDCVNCTKMFGAGSAQTPWRVPEREGKKGGLKEGGRWPGPGPPRFMTDRRHWLRVSPVLSNRGS